MTSSDFIPFLPFQPPPALPTSSEAPPPAVEAKVKVEEELKVKIEEHRGQAVLRLPNGKRYHVAVNSSGTEYSVLTKGQIEDTTSLFLQASAKARFVSPELGTKLERRNDARAVR